MRASRSVQQVGRGLRPRRRPGPAWPAALLLVAALSLAPVGCGSDEDLAGAAARSGLDLPAFEAARENYRDRCASCHGADGEGQANWQTQNPDRTYPAPPHDNGGHTWHHGDGTLFAIIHDGGAIFQDASFRSQMPPYGDLLSDTEIRDMIRYLSSFWGDEERGIQADRTRTDPLPPIE